MLKLRGNMLKWFQLEPKVVSNTARQRKTSENIFVHVVEYFNGSFTAVRSIEPRPYIDSKHKTLYIVAAIVTKMVLQLLWKNRFMRQ